MTTARRRRRQSGNTIVELALILTPMMALFLAIVELSLPIFKKSTFTSAVREGCRYGITYQTSYAGTNYASQTLAIKAVVQANSMGFLTDPTMIFVNYYNPNSSPTPFADVTAGGTGIANADGNVIEVSIQGYTHTWMVPINWIFGSMRFQVTGAALPIVADSADRLESLPVGSARPVP